MAAVQQIAEGVTNLSIADSAKKNRIQVSNTKKPLFFYVNLAKVHLIRLGISFLSVLMRF